MNVKKQKGIFYAVMAALLLIVVTQFSCKKMDSNGMLKNDTRAVEKFLTAPADKNPTVLRIINTVKHQEEKYHFLNGIIAHEGYALWQYARIMPPSGTIKDTMVLIPLVLANTEYVNSFISCKVNDTVAIKLYKGREYASYGFSKSTDSVNAQEIALNCMYFEYEIFKHSKFNIKDKRLLNYRPDGKEPSKTTLTIKPATRVLRTWVTVIYSYEVEVENENPFDVLCPEGQACQWTHTETRYYTITNWYPDFGNWIAADFPQDPWATTGGQGGGNAYPPCGNNCNPVVDSWEVVNDPPIMSQDTILNPCAGALQLQTNASFKIFMQNLKDSLGTYREFAQVLDGTAAGDYSMRIFPQIVGDLNKLEIPDFSFPLGANAMMHSHFYNPAYDSTKGLSIFSPDDLRSMANIFLNGKILDPSEFVMGLVTAKNTQYILKIENLTKFRAWAQKFTQGNFDDFKVMYGKILKIKPTNSNGDNELRFLKYLQVNGNSGLKLFEGNSSFTNWKPVRYDSDSESIVEAPCN